MRADHLGCYGYPRATSPRIDRLAAESVLFERAYAPSFHTADAHMSMLTGLLPSVHRVRNWEEGRSEPSLSPAIRTLAERLQTSAFETAGFHGAGNLSPEYGFGRGFRTYESTQGHDLAPAARWLDERRTAAPGRFFLFVHTYRPHDPYLPDAPFDELWTVDSRSAVREAATELRAVSASLEFAERRRRFWERVDPKRPEDIAELVALYDGEIRQTDGEIGALLDRVDALGAKVLVVLVSDHGEEFFEHGKFKHDDLFEETLRVPWLIRFPERSGAGRRIDSRVSLIDLTPTLLDLLGLPTPETSDGRSLAPALASRGKVEPLPILAEKVVAPDLSERSPFALKQALIVGDEKLMARPSGARLLFDLRADPGERRDVAPARAESLGRFKALLGRWNDANHRRWQELPREARPVVLEPETIEQLRALGYLR